MEKTKSVSVMLDKNGIELSVGQTVKERGHRETAKVISLDSPFVYIKRKDHYDDAPAFPTDLAVIEIHEISVTLQVKTNTEEEAIACVSSWMNEAEKSLPAQSIRYKIGNK